LKHIRRFVIAALFFSGLAACGDRELEQEVLALQGRMRPPNAQLLIEAELVRNSQSAAANWEYESDWSWTEYSTWLKGKLFDYEPVDSDHAKMHFRRRLPNDVFQLDVESAETQRGPPVRIRVSFRAHPE